MVEPGGVPVLAGTRGRPELHEAGRAHRIEPVTRTVAPAGIAREFVPRGYASPIDVCTVEEIDAFRRDFDALEAREGEYKCLHGLLDRHRDLEFIWRLVTNPTILDCVEAIVGPDVLMLSTYFFCKYPVPSPTTGERVERMPGRGSPVTEVFVDWHQDVTYWGLEPAYAVSAWIAIDDSDTENGCMRVIPASHVGGFVPHTTSSKPGNILLSRNQALPQEVVDESKSVDIVLRAGQMSLHHGLLYHGSNPNRSKRRRVGLAVRFSHPGVRPIPGVKATVRRPILLRGVDEPKHWAETPTFPFPLSPPAPRGCA